MAASIVTCQYIVHGGVHAVPCRPPYFVKCEGDHSHSTHAAGHCTTPLTEQVLQLTQYTSMHLFHWFVGVELKKLRMKALVLCWSVHGAVVLVWALGNLSLLKGLCTESLAAVARSTLWRPSGDTQMYI